VGYRGTDKSLARPGRKQATATEDFDFHTNEIFSPSNKIHREVGRAKDLAAPLYHIPEGSEILEFDSAKKKMCSREHQ
jgi:hypothetical protein